MLSSKRVIEGSVVALTILSTIATIVVFSIQSKVLRRTAAVAALIMQTIVLIVEILFHIARPRSDELLFPGPEYLVIFLFAVYEYVPTLYEWGVCGTANIKGCLEWSLGIVGLIIAVLSLSFGLQLLSDLQQLADTIDEYGLLFVIPTTWVGEFVHKMTKCYCGSGTGPAIVINAILFAPFMVLFVYKLPLLTALSYLFSSCAFVTDILFGIRSGNLVFLGEFCHNDQSDLELCTR